MKEEINSSDWGELCERLNDFERGQLVTIEVVEHDGRRKRVESVALEEISFTTINGCNDGIRIRGQGFEHTCLSPLHVRLVKNANGGFNPVEIDAEDGSVILQFKPAIKPTVIDGLGGKRQAVSQ